MFLKPDERRAKALVEEVVAALHDTASVLDSLRDELRNENERRIAETEVPHPKTTYQKPLVSFEESLIALMLL